MTTDLLALIAWTRTALINARRLKCDRQRRRALGPIIRALGPNTNPRLARIVKEIES